MAPRDPRHPRVRIREIYSAYSIHSTPAGVLLSAQQYLLPLQRGMQAFGPKVQLLVYKNIQFRVRICTILYTAQST